MDVKQLKEILEKHGSFSEELYSDLIVGFELELRPLEDRKRDFIDSLRPYIEEYGEEMMTKFGLYWMQIPVRGKKMKFEKEKGWNLKLRIKTWASNEKKFSIVGMLKNK